MPGARKGPACLPGDAALIISPGRTTLAVDAEESAATAPAWSASGTWAWATGDIDWNGEIKPGPLEVGFDESFIMAATGDRVPCVFVRDHAVVGLDPDRSNRS